MVGSVRRRLRLTLSSQSDIGEAFPIAWRQVSWVWPPLARSTNGVGQHRWKG